MKLLLSFVCLSLMFLIGGCSREEESSAPDPKAQEAHNASRLRQLATSLELTTEQQAKVKALFTEENRAIAKIHEEAARTGGDRALRIIATRKNTYESIKPLLTPAQLEKLDGAVKNLEGRKR